MKISLGIVILFFALAHSLSEVPDIFDDDDTGHKIDIAKFMEFVNFARLKESKDEKISNMNQLTWEDDLVTKADKLSCDNEHDDGPTFNVITFPGKNELKQMFYASDPRMEKAFKRPLVPVHSKVGCTKHLCDGKDRFFCALSPKFDLSENLVKKGRAGTECESGSKNKDGLCLPGQFESEEAIERQSSVTARYISGGPEDDRRVSETKANFDSDSSPSNVTPGCFSLVLSLSMILFGF